MTIKIVGMLAFEENMIGPERYAPVTAGIASRPIAADLVQPLP
jgi:hypothetical protein